MSKSYFYSYALILTLEIRVNALHMHKHSLTHTCTYTQTYTTTPPIFIYQCCSGINILHNLKYFLFPDIPTCHSIKTTDRSLNETLSPLIHNLLYSNLVYFIFFLLSVLSHKVPPQTTEALHTHSRNIFNSLSFSSL